MPARQGNALFASYNIHKCVGTDRRFDPARIAQVIAEISPDVIALQEADRRFGDRAGLLDLRALERETGLTPIPVVNNHAGHGWHGNLVLVREAMIEGLHQIRLPGLEPRGALVADIALAAGPVRVVAAHLGLLRASRLLQIEALLAHVSAEIGRPVIMMGDLNEWRRQRRSALHGFQPVFGPLGRGVPSFPAYFPVLALDRVFAQPEDILARLEAHDSPLARVASDHLPMKAHVRLGQPMPDRVGAQAPAAIPAHIPAASRRRPLLRRLRREERPDP